MLTIIFVLFIVAFVLMIPYAFIKVARTKSTECMTCGRKMKMVTDRVKCPFCKTKYFKHADGTYRIQE
ncbi:hypothetical protein [Metasolibacillus sp.]|uniref:hypothetical protein n=1 Tax=Metasolibacillus sp. TaxID=2703680 RepID=UPI0025F987C7|nr:hypothetical protein [Metasolibacillus sp.]MCT6924103.1 hypothetical protein [Metasolibacillus sp.]MCT6940210.1 hypothetical protein [Metasolibacillus sp.]